MYKDIDLTKQGIGYKPRIIDPNKRIIAILLFIVATFSCAASIIYSSPLPFFLALTVLLLIPSALIVIFTITPEALLGIHIFFRLILDSAPAITYKNIIGALSIMKLYSTGFIVFGLIYLVCRREIKLNWLLILFSMILFTSLATTIYHQTWFYFLEGILKWAYLWLIIVLTKLSIHRIDFKHFSIAILVFYLYPILNFLYSVAIGSKRCADGVCRFIGTYSHQGVFSFILLTIIPFTLYLLIAEKRIIKKCFYAVILLLAHVGIYSSSYRTTWVALAFYWLGFLVFFIREISLHKKVLLSLVTAMVIGYLLVPGSYVGDKIGERLAPLASILQEPYKYFDLSSNEAYRIVTGKPYVAKTEENLLLSGRIGDWKALIIAYRDAPIEEKIVGMGVGMDRTIMGNYKWGEAYDAHNIYIRALVETGILGLVALLIFISVISFKLVSRFKQHSLPIIIATPMFLSYIVGGLASTMLDDIRMILCVGLCLGTALYYRESLYNRT